MLQVLPAVGCPVSPASNLGAKHLTYDGNMSFGKCQKGSIGYMGFQRQLYKYFFRIFYKAGVSKNHIVAPL